MIALQDVQDLDYESIDTRSHRLTYQRNHTNHTICDYMSIKGLQSTGTHWLEYILTLIRTHICHSSNLNQHASICYDRSDLKQPKKIGLWLKSIKTDLDKVDRSLPKSKHYDEVQRLTMRYSNLRVCHFIALRDPRDRIISSTYFYFYQAKVFQWRKLSALQNEENMEHDDVAGLLEGGLDLDSMLPLKEDHGVDESKMNEEIYKHFGNNIQKLNEWWEFYKQKEESKPNIYFTYFYEDLINDPYTLIRMMLIYIGVYPHIVDDTQIDDIVSASRFDVMMSHDEKWKVHWRMRNGKNCDFDNKENKIRQDTVQFMNIEMKENLMRDLLYKFNSNCPVLIEPY